MTALLTRNEIARLLPARPLQGHKGDFGHLFVVAGSRGYTGAVKLVCEGAARAGVGLVTAGIPAPLADVVAALLVEAMTLPLPATHAESLALAALEPIMEAASDRSAMVVGPGLSRHFDTARLARQLVLERPLPMVVDADGLNAFEEQRGRLVPRNGNGEKPGAVFTPHPGEMARLTGLDTRAIQEDRPGIAAQYAALWEVVVVLKGAGTIVAAPDGRVRCCPTGNEGMATGGTGDVLAGIIGALLAQGVAPFEAACIGAYAHGLAGDIAAKEKTARALIARDVVEALPAAWRELEETDS